MTTDITSRLRIHGNMGDKWSMMLSNEAANEIEFMRQQLANSQQREVMLRDALKNVLWDETWTRGVIVTTNKVKAEEALATTADLDGLILCEKKPFAWVGMSGHGAIVSMTPPTVQPDLWKQCYIAAKDQWK